MTTGQMACYRTGQIMNSQQIWNTLFARSMPIILRFMSVAPFVQVVVMQLHFGTLMPSREGATIPLHNWEAEGRGDGAQFFGYFLVAQQESNSPAGAIPDKV